MTRAEAVPFEPGGGPPCSGWGLWELCAAGKYPAEALYPWDRAYLVRSLHARGLTDVEIAEWTWSSTYTAGRIRRELGLAPNQGWLAQHQDAS